MESEKSESPLSEKKIGTLDIPNDTVTILRKSGICYVHQLEDMTYDELLSLKGMTKTKCRNVIVRMAEKDVYLKDSDKKPTKNYIISLLKEYYEGRMTGLPLRTY